MVENGTPGASGKVHINYRFEAAGDAVHVLMDRWVDSGHNTLEVVTLPVDAIDPDRLESTLDRPASLVPWDQVPPQARSNRHRIVIHAKAGRYFEKSVERRSSGMKTNEERFHSSGNGTTTTVTSVTLWTDDGTKAEALIQGLQKALG